MSARVRLNMKRSPLESQGDRSKQRRKMEDPDDDEVMIGEVQVKEEVEHPTSEVSVTEFDDSQQKEYEGILRELQSQNEFIEFPCCCKFRGHEQRGHQNSLGAETTRGRCQGKICDETLQQVERRKQRFLCRNTNSSVVQFGFGFGSKTRRTGKVTK